jgi:hypothetical protein
MQNRMQKERKTRRTKTLFHHRVGRCSAEEGTKGTGSCDAAGVLMLQQVVQRKTLSGRARSASSSAGRSARLPLAALLQGPAVALPAGSCRRPWRRVIGGDEKCESMREVWKLQKTTECMGST